ncbi:MAG: 2-isopropylmalate synthase [Verrucomicrobia bacterium]|nr:MAG: 2-isopropylmalate synthase [Verrucomicrobiota bacterium]
MQPPPITKYRPFPTVDLPDRQWPNRTITRPPIWCSVDLRDGNQALAIPMSVDEKLEMFDTLVKVGFKEIEVGFPAASQIEFDFIRRLIDEDRIPEDVTIQILTQAREELIRRSYEALRGARRVIFHLYNSTNPTQRRVVFGLDRDEIKAIAVRGTTMARDMQSMVPETEVVFQYSPESFSLTELDFSLEVCEAVTEVWGPTKEKKIILNLPATVEVATPNVHADQIEWFCRHFSRRDEAIISLHTHNDRGCAVAATELGLMAGADRVEGTLFGNGERTGNVDIVTVALNMYSQGVHPGLDFSNLNAIRDVYERCTRMEVPPRQPYAGELVFTAFSGSHQDAINKGFAERAKLPPDAPWDVPYLPIDPKDLGRNYRAIIRINAQSGKGGVAHVMQREFGFQLPKAMHREVGRLINDLADRKGTELTPEEILEAFTAEYLERKTPYEVLDFHTEMPEPHNVTCRVTLKKNGEAMVVSGSGNGPIDAFVHALGQAGVSKFEVLNYAEHSIGQGAGSKAAAYIQIRTASGHVGFGVGLDTNIELASINAVLSAVNRAAEKGAL